MELHYVGYPFHPYRRYQRLKRRILVNAKLQYVILANGYSNMNSKKRYGTVYRKSGDQLIMDGHSVQPIHAHDRLPAQHFSTNQQYYMYSSRALNLCLTIPVHVTTILISDLGSIAKTMTSNKRPGKRTMLFSGFSPVGIKVTSRAVASYRSRNALPDAVGGGCQINGRLARPFLLENYGVQ